MKYRSILLGCLAVVIIGAVTWHFKCFFITSPIDPKKENPFGFYLIDGEKNRDLGIIIRNAAHSKMTGPGKRLSVLNETANELIYQDPSNFPWLVPKGTVNDGASVPPLLESFIAGGLNTDARYAAIVHDHFCDEMNSPGHFVAGGYPAIHRMFYHAMLCSGVDKRTAGFMYAAVVKFGPPQDRSLWVKFLARAMPEEVRLASNDVESSISKWVGDNRITEENGTLLVVAPELQTKLDLARLDIERAETKKEKAESDLASIEKAAGEIASAANIASGNGETASHDEDMDQLLKDLATIQEEIIRVSKEKDDAVKSIQAHQLEIKTVVEEANQTTAEAERVANELEELKGFLSSMQESEITTQAIDAKLAHP